MFEFFKNLFGGAKRELEVSLNLSGNPKVEISEEDASVKGHKKIRWKRKAGETFKFKRLNDLNQVYFNRQSISLDREQVSCRNRAPDDPTKEYEYEIVVTLNNNEYTSTKSGSPPGGKPVIRN
jgi:hypothetical protein